MEELNKKLNSRVHISLGGAFFLDLCGPWHW